MNYLQRNEILNKIRFFIFLITTAYIIVAYCLNSYIQIFFPYQLEYREAALATIVKNILHGINPYSFDLQPFNTYVYGIGYPMAVSFISIFTKIEPLIAGRLLSFFSIFFASFLIFKCILSVFNGKDKIFAFLLSSSMLIFWNTHSGVGAIPTSFAVLIICSSTIIPFLYSFSFKSCLLAIFISIIGYFIKAYCLISFGFIISFLFLFKSKKESIFLFTIGISFFMILFLSSNLYFPAFRAATLDIIYCTNFSSYGHMLNQISDIFNAFILLKWLILMLIIRLYDLEFSNYKFPNFNFKSNNGLFLIQKNQASVYFGLCTFISFIAFYIKLGRHTGAFGGGYLTHICLPFLLIFIASFYDKFKNKILIEITLVVILFFGALHIYQYFNQSKHRYSNNKEKLKIIESNLKKHDKIYNSPEMTSIMLHLNKKVYNNGQSEYLNDALGCKNEQISKVEQTLINYKKDIEIKLSSKFFDLVLLTHGYTGMDYINKETLQINYFLLKIEYTPVGEYGWNTEYWVRKD